MLKKIAFTTVIALQGTGFCLAQATAPSVPVDNPHKAYDQLVRACKKQALDQSLTGEVRRSFIAQCVTTTPSR
jgi:hypothetical protein